jgi:hypothetical protein
MKKLNECATKIGELPLLARIFPIFFIARKLLLERRPWRYRWPDRRRGGRGGSEKCGVGTESATIKASGLNFFQCREKDEI